ncbi:MAG TPA: tetratricopeptide repeat protein [Vicinamibacterales bacterium]|nr:tetratricopeptide repeat protein [Vicinamibacterales bacterium]
MRHLATTMLTIIVGLALCSAQAADDRRLALLHYRAGLDLLAAEAWQDAEREFRRALELDPSLALAHYGLGRAYMGMKHFQRAIGAYTTCRTMFLGQAGTEATRQLERSRRRQEQVFELRQAIREQQRAIQTTRTQRAIQLMQEQVIELERQMSRGDAVELELAVPAFVSLALGSAYFRTGDLPQAERFYREAIQTNPAFGEAYNNLAVVCLLTGRAEEAERHVKAAERNGYRVHPQLKRDIREARKGG